jgi:hypothetical protein
MWGDAVPEDGGRANQSAIDISGTASGPLPRTGRRASGTEQRDCGELLCWVVTHPPTHTLEAGSSSARGELLREAVVAVRAKWCSDAVTERLPCAGVGKPEVASELNLRDRTSLDVRFFQQHLRSKHLDEGTEGLLGEVAGTEAVDVEWVEPAGALGGEPPRTVSAPVDTEQAPPSSPHKRWKVAVNGLH